MVLFRMYNSQKKAGKLAKFPDEKTYSQAALTQKSKYEDLKENITGIAWLL